jgi:hypothetical protein
MVDFPTEPVEQLPQSLGESAINTSSARFVQKMKRHLPHASHLG